MDMSIKRFGFIAVLLYAIHLILNDVANVFSISHELISCIQNGNLSDLEGANILYSGKR